MRTDFDKIWTKMIKNDGEYATQATFSLSYFDAMTHILLGQNCMKTQAKYDFSKNTIQFPHFVHAEQKTLNASHAK